MPVLVVPGTTVIAATLSLSILLCDKEMIRSYHRRVSIFFSFEIHDENTQTQTKINDGVIILTPIMA